MTVPDRAPAYEHGLYAPLQQHTADQVAPDAASLNRVQRVIRYFGQRNNGPSAGAELAPSAAVEMQNTRGQVDSRSLNSKDDRFASKQAAQKNYNDAAAAARAKQVMETLNSRPPMATPTAPSMRAAHPADAHYKAGLITADELRQQRARDGAAPAKTYAPRPNMAQRARNAKRAK